MEFIDGMSIDAKVAEGLFSIEDIVSVGTAIARGLKVAHDHDIVHRDVKSANIMLGADGQPKILDFGLAKTTASTKLTQIGSTMGTSLVGFGVVTRREVSKYRQRGILYQLF